MAGLGTLINVACIIAGGLAGMLCGKLINEKMQETMVKAAGLASMFIGISGTLAEMLVLENGGLSVQKAMMATVTLALGAFIGELLNIEKGFEDFGEWLKIKSGNASDHSFVNAFLTASLTVSIGAMAIVGSIQDGILGDYSTLATKGILDFVIVMIMTSSLGKGSIFSAIPVAVFQGTMTLAARLLKVIMNAAAIANVSLVGSILIFGVGVNLVFGKTIRIANLLPAVVLAIAAAYL